MKKITYIFLIGFLCVSFGCASVFKRRAQISQDLAKADSQQAVVILEGDLPIVAGFELFEDKRPASHIAYMSSVRENVSQQILEAIKKVNIFSQIHYPAMRDEPFIIRGEIRRFRWESFDTMVSYIPVMNVFNLFGLPSTRTNTEVAVYVQVLDNKTNTVVVDFTEQYIKKAQYNIYNFKESKAKEELAYCFQELLNTVQQRLIQEKQKIIDVAKKDFTTASVSQPQQIDEKMKEAEEKMKAVQEKIKEVEKKADAVEKIAQEVEQKVKNAQKKAKEAEEKVEEENEVEKNSLETQEGAND